MQPQPTGDLDARIRRLEDIYLTKVGFGNPTDPTDPSGTVLAGSSATAHNGVVDNIRGAWVTVKFTARRSATTVFHNLQVPLSTPTQLNVRWIDFGMSCTLAVSVSHVLNYVFKRTSIITLTENSFDLQAYGNVVISASDPLFATLFVIPAVRRPQAL